VCVNAYNTTCAELEEQLIRACDYVQLAALLQARPDRATSIFERSHDWEPLGLLHHLHYTRQEHLLNSVLQPTQQPAAAPPQQPRPAPVRSTIPHPTPLLPPSFDQIT
jgi:hypothetical protein